MDAVRLLLRRGVALVAEDETDDVEGWQASPEAFVKSQLVNANSNELATVLNYLRDVRKAGGWRSFVTEQRHSLGVLRALWRQSPNFIRKPPRDEAVLCKLFEMPDDLFAMTVHFYTDLHF